MQVQVFASTATVLPQRACNLWWLSVGVAGAGLQERVSIVCASLKMQQQVFAVDYANASQRHCN